ncbi:MAG TPA: DUF5985 family protein [Caulobacteraceae bacterium]
MIVPILVYSLCVVTCAVCGALLARAYLRSQTPLLFWTAIGFGFFTVNNLLLAADLLVFTEIDLLAWRQLATGLGLGALLYGFIRNAA